MTYQSAFEIVQRLVRENRPTAVCPSNTHILSEARHDPEFARVMSNFDLIFPDGMPVVRAMNLRGAGLSDRVYGPYFMKYPLERTPRPWRHFCFCQTRSFSKEYCCGGFIRPVCQHFLNDSTPAQPLNFLNPSFRDNSQP